MISRIHLNAEGHNPGSSETSEGIPEENFELNMGRNKSPIKYDKEIIKCIKKLEVSILK